MRTLIAGALLLCPLFSTSSRAQRGGMPSAPPAAFRPAAPAHPQMTGFKPERNFNTPYGFAPWGWGFPLSSDYGVGSNCAQSPPSPQVVVVAPPLEPPVPPPPPPPPPQPVTREYHWPAPEPANDRGAAFSLVLKDSTVRFAAAVWTQDGTLRYTDPNGTPGAIPLDSIDRDATRRLNAENRLTLSLPDHAALP